MAKSKKKKRKIRGMGFLRFQLILLAIVVALLAYYYVGGYASQINKMHKEAVEYVSSSTRDTFKKDETSEAYDDNGKVISVLKGDRDVYYLTYDEIPTEVRQAIVSIEDKKFYEHHGVDYKAIIRAVWAMVRNGRVTQGGSTITQQLARNVFLSQEKTWQRKIEEIYIAVELEKKYSKQDILEFYLNNIYFANGYYGIEAASQGYFGKDVSELSTSQIALLVGIPNSPTRYDPREHLSAALTRRNLVLKNMLDDGILTEDEYQEAVSEEITIKDPKTVHNNYEETYLYYCATRALMEKDGFEFKTSFTSDEEQKKYEKEYDEAYDEENAKLYTGGYRIYTSLNKTMQKKLQKSINTGLASFTEKDDDGIYKMQGAAVCIDNDTGCVKAIVGGRSQKNLSGYTLNRAFQSFRQPGSSIKPLIVYTPALENGYTPDTIVNDKKIKDGPSNADGTYLGKITLRRAVELSRNTVAWQIYDKITPQVGISYLRAMNFSEITDSDTQNMAACLGGLTNGVSPLEMASAYTTLENDGAYREPTCILKITDSEDNVVYENQYTESIIYKENSAKEMTDILEGVFTEGTARGLGLGDMPCAGKTGTTNDHKDGWFVGYTAYYTTAVWVGYDIPQELSTLSGSTYPGKIWQNFMLQAHDGLKVKDLDTTVTKVKGEERREFSDEDVSSEESDESETDIDVTLTPSDEDTDSSDTSSDTGNTDNSGTDNSGNNSSSGGSSSGGSDNSSGGNSGNSSGNNSGSSSSDSNDTEDEDDEEPELPPEDINDDENY